MTITRPLIVSIPEPRTLDLIFTPGDLAELRRRYRLVEGAGDGAAAVLDRHLSEATYLLGQPPLPRPLLDRAANLKAVFNVESNLLDNMDYDTCFARGIHVLTTGKVFAQPVAEIGLGLALALERGICAADRAFRAGDELWGGDGNREARLMQGAEIGLVGCGDLGRALLKLLAGFRSRVLVYDPWLPPSSIRELGVEPAPLATVLSQSDVIFVVASVTSENGGFLDAMAFASMRKGASFILLSRAGIVDFDALMAAVRTGHIRAASDVYPQEPLPRDHPVRGLENFVLSAHRAGALDVAFKRMGRMVIEDMDLIDRGLPPLSCKRAERETVRRMRSKPVTRN